MKRSIGLWQFFGFAVVSLSGTVLHFLYDWLDGAIWIAPFSGVNESTFEHMKLLFWPTFLFAAVQFFFFRDRKDLLQVKARGILLGLSLIPIIFYTYNGAIGRSPDLVNVSIFFISAAASFLYELRLFSSGRLASRSQRRALVFLLGLAVIFVIFTFRAPHLGIFRDPLTGGYGIGS